MIILSTLNHLKELVVNDDETTENNNDDYYDYQDDNNNIDDQDVQSENDDGQYDPVEIQLTYEEVDQLRCYLQCAILLEEDVTTDLDHNYELLDFDAVAEIGRPGVRMNIGVDSFEFLMLKFLEMIPMDTSIDLTDMTAIVDMSMLIYTYSFYQLAMNSSSNNIENDNVNDKKE